MSLRAMAAWLRIDGEPPPLEERRKSPETDHVVAALDLLVDALQGDGGVDLGAVLLGEGHERQDAGFRPVQELNPALSNTHAV